MYLRWQRFAFFQLTSALCLTVTGLASWGLAVGNEKIAKVAGAIPGATLSIADALNSGGAVTAAAGLASLLCLYLQYLGHFRKRDRETIKSVRIKEGLFAFAAIFWIATLIPATLIMATRSGVVTKPGVPDAVIAQVIALSGENLAYNTQTPIKSYVIVGWLAFASTLMNLILVSLAARHTLKHGPDGEIGTLVGHHDNHIERTDIKSLASTEAEKVQSKSEMEHIDAIAQV